MTSNRGAGFSSNPRGRQEGFGSASVLASASSASGGAKRAEASPEEVAREAEARVHGLLEAAAELVERGEAPAGKWRAGVGGADVHTACSGLNMQLAWSCPSACMPACHT